MQPDGSPPHVAQYLRRISNTWHHSFWFHPETQMSRCCRCMRSCWQSFPLWLIWALALWWMPLLWAEYTCGVFILHVEPLCFKKKEGGGGGKKQNKTTSSTTTKKNMFTVSACVRSVAVATRLMLGPAGTTLPSNSWVMIARERVGGGDEGGPQRRQQATKTGSMRGETSLRVVKNNS